MSPMWSLNHLALLLIASSSVCNCATITKESYLSVPTDFNNDFHRSIRTALEKLEITEDIGNDGIAREVGLTEDNPKYAAEYKALFIYLKFAMKQNYLMNCVKETFISAWAQITNDPEGRLDAWRSYIKETALEFFQRSANMLVEVTLFNQWFENKMILEGLDEMFRVAFELKKDKHEVYLSELRQKLEEFDLTESSFNAKRMIKALKKFTPELDDPFELLKKYMLGKCRRLNDIANIRQLVTLVDLARYFGGRIWINEELARTDEYQRLCLALETPAKTNLIRDNLNKQLTSKCMGWFCA